MRVAGSGSNRCPCGDGAIAATAPEAVGGGAKGDRLYGAAVASEDAAQFPGEGVPEFDEAIVAAAGEQGGSLRLCSGGVEGEGGNGWEVPGEGVE